MMIMFKACKSTRCIEKVREGGVDELKVGAEVEAAPR